MLRLDDIALLDRLDAGDYERLGRAANDELRNLESETPHNSLGYQVCGTRMRATRLLLAICHAGADGCLSISTTMETYTGDHRQ